MYTYRNKCISHWTVGNVLEDCTILKGKTKFKENYNLQTPTK